MTHSCALRLSDRKEQMNFPSRPWLGENRQLATDPICSLLHTNQSEAATQGAYMRIESCAVVFHSEMNCFRFQSQSHIDLGATRMFHGVGDGLLRDAQEIAFDFRC